MQAIRTRYIGPSDTKGSRITASCEAKSKTFSYNHSVNGDENHRRAAFALAREMEWENEFVGGQFGRDHYFVFDDWRSLRFSNRQNSVNPKTAYFALPSELRNAVTAILNDGGTIEQRRDSILNTLRASSASIDYRTARDIAEWMVI